MNIHHPAATVEAVHYNRPGWLTRNVMNRATARLTRLGISVWGSRVLRVRGRTSGQVRSNPVNVLTLGGERYLVSPRGQTDWVRNLRIAGTGELTLGRQTESFTATEISGRAIEAPKIDTTADSGTDDLAITVLRAYLRRWKWEVGQFFDGVGPDSTDAELLEVAHNHPIFGIAVVSR